MKGYSSLKQYVQDYKLYLAAKKIDPGKEGETITSFLKKNMELKMKNSSTRFKKMIKEKKYTTEDLKIIAVHDVIGDISELRDFIRICFGDNYVSPHYKTLLSTNAFKSGRLKRIYEFIPLSIKTKREFLDFIKSNRYMTKLELNTIMKRICEGDWRSWANDLLNENVITFRKGGYI